MKYVRLNEKLNNIRENKDIYKISDDFEDIYQKHKPKGNTFVRIDDFDDEGSINLIITEFVDYTNYISDIRDYINNNNLFVDAINCGTYRINNQSKNPYGLSSLMLSFNKCIIEEIKNKDFDVVGEYDYFGGEDIAIYKTDIVNISFGANVDELKTQQIRFIGNKKLSNISLSKKIKPLYKKEPILLFFKDNANIKSIDIDNINHPIDIYILNEEDVYILDIIKDKIKNRTDVTISLPLSMPGPEVNKQPAKEYFSK